MCPSAYLLACAATVHLCTAPDCVHFRFVAQNQAMNPFPTLCLLHWKAKSLETSYLSPPACWSCGNATDSMEGCGFCRYKAVPGHHKDCRQSLTFQPPADGQRWRSKSRLCDCAEHLCYERGRFRPMQDSDSEDDDVFPTVN
jgi:hypothetical protein